MKAYMTGEREALERRARLNLLDSCSTALLELLEHKFLYQAIMTETTHCRPRDLAKRDFNEVIGRLERDFFLPATKEKEGLEDVFALLNVPETINTSCEYCDGEKTPHNPMFDIQRFFDKNKHVENEERRDQTLVFSFQCQKCKRGELVFLVRRTGLKFQLVGRNQIDKGKKLWWAPVHQRNLFAEALIASRTGSDLAAVCLLRIAIERHMREVARIDTPASGDELWEQYKTKVSSKFLRTVEPTLKRIYGQLSAIMHGTSGDAPQVFQSCWQATEAFFKLKEIMK